MTINFPVTSTTFIDRYLATAEAYQVPVAIAFNKVDRYGHRELAVLRAKKAFTPQWDMNVLAYLLSQEMEWKLLSASFLRGLRSYWSLWSREVDVH